MVRTSVSRWGLAVLSAAAVLSGCLCGGGQDDCSDVTVKFESPTAGAEVVAPFDVEIRASDSAGVAYKFDTATLTADGVSKDGTVSGATARFVGVQLDPGPHTLTARIEKGTCSRTASIDITVKREGCTTPAVTAVSFPQDTSNDGILNAAELPPGTNLSVRVTAECTAGVQVQVRRGATVVGGPADFSNGVATVTLPTLPDSDSATYDLVAELVKDGAPVGMSLGGSIRVERALPACENTTELVQGPRNGGTGADHLLTATGRTTGVSAEFRLDGARAMTSSPSMGSVSASWMVPRSGETTYAVELRCRDNFGNVATDTKMVRVDYVPPTAVITQPPANPDGGATVVTDSPAAVQVMTNAEDTAQACAFRVRGTTRTAVGCANVAGGAASLSVPFALDGTYTIEVEVTDLAGNTTTTSVQVDVVLSGCGLAFTRPPACPALITAAQASNGFYSFQTQSNPSCAGQTVRLGVQTVFADGGVGPLTPVGTGAVGGGGLATIVGTVTSGSYVYSAEVDNLGADGGVTRASCDVTVDLEGPAIQNPFVLTGEPYATINVLQDTQPATCGAQRLLQFSARIPAGGSAIVCTTQAIDPCTNLTRATSADCGAGWYVLQSNVTSPAAGFTFTEGEYSIKVVVVGGGTTVESAPVPVFVDVTRPCVRRRMNPWPQDVSGGAPDGRLNIAELGAAAPRLEFELDPACKDTDPSTLSATNPVVVRELVGGVPTGAFNVAADATFASGVYSVNLTQNLVNEKDYAFFVELTDKAGNKNLYTGGALDPARYDMRIDKVAPTCDIIAPSATQTLLGQAAVPGGQFTVTVGTSADVPMNGVSVTLSGPTMETRQLTPSGPANQAQTVFTVTGTNSWTVSSTCTDVAGNATPATTRNLTIDLDAPTCTITSPTNSAPYTVNDIQTTVNVTGADGQLVSCNTNGTPLTPQMQVSSGVATAVLSYPNGTQTVACSVADPAGNAATCQVANVVVNSMSCGLVLTSTQTTASGFWHNRSNTGNLTANTGTATVTANTPDCGAGKTVTLQRVEPTTGTAVTATTDASGNVSFPGVNLTDGERWEVTIDNGAGLTTTRSFRVGLVAPAAAGVTINGAAVTTGTNLYFVAASGNRNAETNVAGYFADTNAGAAGAQFDVVVNGVTGAFKANLNGTVRLVFKGSTVGVPQNVTGDGQNFTFTGATLPHNDSGAFEVRVEDTAGNSTAVISNPAAIDVIAPGAPSVTQTLTSARAAQVTLQWAPTYDDGTDPASGGHAGYDVRWTTSSVPNNNAMATSADYFGSSSYQESLSTWSAMNITRVLDLPPLNTYYIAVRAKDEVGNYSSFVAPTGLENNWTTVTISNPSTDSTASAHAFGQYTIVADSLNGDMSPDIVISAPNRGPTGSTNIGSVYIYYGGVSSSTNTCPAATCQELTPYDNASGLFGTDISAAGNVGDIPGETKPDLVIAQPLFQTDVGRAFLYFGTSGTKINASQYIEFRGTPGSLFGSAARIIKDIDGDGIDEIAISAHGEDANQGRLYIFKGRSADPTFMPGTPGANWFNSRTGTDGTNLYIPSSAATWVLSGPTPVLTGGNQFARMRWGLISIGDITGDGRSEFIVPMSKDVAGGNTVFLYSAATVAASTSPLPTSSAIQALVGPTPYTNTATTDGFGRAAVAGNLLGASAPDLLVANPRKSEVYLYQDLAAVGVAGGNPNLTFVGAANQFFGIHLSRGDLNGDGLTDLAIGQSPRTDWIVWQHSGSFDTVIDGNTPRFWLSKFFNANSGSRQGRMTGIGDTNADGQLDFLMGDEGLGMVVIYR